MESTPTSLLGLLPLTAATILLLWIWRSHDKKRRRLPPGPRGLPLLGSLPFVDPELHRYFAGVAAKYGPVSSVRLGSRLYVVVSSPSAAREVLKLHDTVFANRPPFYAMKAFNGGVDLVFTPNGPLLRLMRKVVAKEVLSPTVIDSFQWLRKQVVGDMISDLESKVGTEVNLRDTLHSATLNQMLRMIWEDAQTEKGRGVMAELLRVIHSAMEYLAAPNISDFLPLLAPLDLQGMQRKVGALSARFHEILDSIMAQRAPGGGARDFIQLLVDIIDKKDPEMPLELIHARGLLFDLITGGIDTTSTTVEWAMFELTRHPEIMARVQTELDSVVGRGRVVQESHVPKLVFLKAVMKEALRLHPILPILPPHSPSADAEIGGYAVPAGAVVVVHVEAIQRDPSLWEEPLEFRPERFLEREEEVSYNGTCFEYLPFGSGRRMCAGMSLGERTMMHLAGSLLHAFRWRLPRGASAADAEDKYGTVTKKKVPLVLVPAAKD